MPRSPVESLHFMAQVLFAKKGLSLMALDVRGLSSLTDYLLIGEGYVERHVVAMAQTLLEEVGRVGSPLLLYVEGLSEGDWVVLDYGEIMVHLFMPGLRERYHLERLWPESRLVDLDLDRCAGQSQVSS